MMVAGLAVSAIVACLGAQPEAPGTGDVTPGFTLGPDGTWVQSSAPDPDSDAGVMAEAARLIASGKHDAAKDMLDDWIDEHERDDNPYLARAYLLRGDARVADRDEYKALYDYEIVITDFPDSDEYLTAIRREVEIANAYLDGLRRKFLGLRIDSGRLTGEELLIRTQERLPESRLAEDAAFRLARHYYDRGEMRLAADMYAIFRANYPESTRAREALLGQIFSNVARFNGPAHDAAGLLEAQLLLDRYRNRYPADAENSAVISGLGKRIDESRAAHMLEAAEWYLRVGNESAGRFTLRRLLRKHPRAEATQRALRLMEDRGWLSSDGDAPGPGVGADAAGRVP